jgi:hypothetical protein
MIEELVVHIGPAKTSTTAVQVAFSRLKDYLATQGFFYEPNLGSIANYRMARFLAGTAVEELANLSVEQLRCQPDFPSLSSSGRQMISCEDFAGLREQERIDCIVRWADPKHIRLVIAFREPTRWLWSLFQQTARDQLKPSDGWTKFVENSLAESMFFFSNMLKPWLQVGPSLQIVMIDQTINPVILTPMLIAKALDIELIPEAIQDSTQNLYNESLGLGESMLMPMFNEEVVNELQSRQQNLWGDIPQAFAKKVLLYQTSTAKVMFELGRELENQHLKEPNNLLDESSFVSLQNFSDAWWDDFDRTLIELKTYGHIDLPEVHRQRPPIFSGYDLPIGKGFPRPNFENLIELPPEFFSLARLYASNIGLLFKAMSHQDQVSWLKERM